MINRQRLPFGAARFFAHDHCYDRLRHFEKAAPTTMGKGMVLSASVSGDWVSRSVDGNAAASSTVAAGKRRVCGVIELGAVACPGAEFTGPTQRCNGGYRRIRDAAHVATSRPMPQFVAALSDDPQDQNPSDVGDSPLRSRPLDVT